MIKNDRQYHITKVQADKFQQALDRLVVLADAEREGKFLRQIQQEALQSQLDELHDELAEYEALRAGRRPLPDLASYADLPRVLIRRRIAAGLTQKALADRLGLKEQQVQLYEATDYTSASFARLLDVMRALDLQPAGNGAIADSELSLSTVYARLKDLGFDNQFAATRLIPRQLLAQLESVRGAGADVKTLVLRTADAAGRVLGLPSAALLGATAPELDMRPALGSARFKVATRVDEVRVGAYAVYAHYLALLLLEATHALPRQPVPTDWRDVREGIIRSYGTIGFAEVLRYMWDSGVPVLPLRDAAAFHGACWRVAGRNVIVLKQRTRSSARWTFDGLHEFRHAGQTPEQDSFSVVEAEDQDREHLLQNDEQLANDFAGNVLLDGRAEELAHRCAREAGGSIPLLKTVVPRVAVQEHVAVGALANYLAHRLAMEGQNWWGVAMTLQAGDTDAWTVARDVLLERANLGRLNDVDQAVLTQAFTGEEG